MIHASRGCSRCQLVQTNCPLLCFYTSRRFMCVSQALSRLLYLARTGTPASCQDPERECCLLVLNSVTSTPQWIRQPEAAWGTDVTSPRLSIDLHTTRYTNSSTTGCTCVATLANVRYGRFQSGLTTPSRLLASTGGFRSPVISLVFIPLKVRSGWVIHITLAGSWLGNRRTFH